MYYYDEVDYSNMFSELGFDLPKQRKGMVSCPLHTDRHPSMSVDTTTGLFNCFSCGFHGRIDKLFKEKTGQVYGKKTLYNVNDLRTLFKTRAKPKVLNTKKAFFKATFEKYKSSILKDWLVYRGIDFTVAEAAQVFYGNVDITFKTDTGEEKTYTVHDRICFPIYDEKHQMCSLEMRFPFFGTESKEFKNSVKKVLYPKNSSVNILYDAENLDKTKKLYVMEGLMDCLAFRSLTKIKNSTSIFGSQITAHQKELLNEFPEICYVYNNDTAGLKSLESLRQSYTGKFSELKPAKDYDDVGEMAMNNFKEIQNWLLSEKSQN